MQFSSADYPIFLLAVFFMFALLRVRGPVQLVARALMLLVLGDLVYLLLAKNVASLWDPVGGLLLGQLAGQEPGQTGRSLEAYALGAALFTGAALLGYRGGGRLDSARARTRLAVAAAVALVLMGVAILVCERAGRLEDFSTVLSRGGHLGYLALLGLAIGAALSVNGRAFGRLLILFLVSAIFYHAWAAGMVGAYRYLLLLILATIVLDYYLALWLARAEAPGMRRLLLVVSLVSNLGVLALFKYFDFFLSSADQAAGWFGWRSSVEPFALILPAGISFHTFQSLSYTIDVYRRRIEPTRSVLHFAAFVLFFPQLVAGPIVRADQFMPQLSAEPALDPAWADRAARGLFRIMLGLFKKIALADFLGRLHVNRVFLEPSLFSGIEVLFAVYGWAFQLYLDFSAYSDIAIGSAALLGYEFPENFRTPYRSANLQEFWRRWHITLSSWLRDYLYIPLGGSRSHTYRNLAITMVLGGLWHGGSWNYVIWGALHGGGLAATRVFQRRAAASPAAARRLVLLSLVGGGALLGLHLALAPELSRLGEAMPIGGFWIHVLLAWLYLTPAWASLSAWLSREDAGAGAEDNEVAAAEAAAAGPASPPLVNGFRLASLAAILFGLGAVHDGLHNAWMPLLAAWMALAFAADVADRNPDLRTAARLALRGLRRGLAILLTFHYVCFAWVFFRTPTLERTREVLTQIAGGTMDSVNLSAPYLLVLAAAACAHMFPPATFRWLRDRFILLHPVGRAVVLAAGAVVLKELSSPIVVPFIYFQF